MKKGKKITLLSGLALSSLGLAHCINKLIFFSATSKERLHYENSNYYNWRFGKIFYTKKGSGLPLLLIHDLNCTSSIYEWKKIIDKLSKNYTVYAIDLLGCGRSEKPKMTYTNYLYVQLINDFIKNVIKHKTHVIATGNSVAIASMACYIDSQLFDRIIFVNPDNLISMNKYPRYNHRLLRYVIDIPIIGTSIYNNIVSKCNLKKEFKHNYFFNKNAILSSYINAYYEAAHLGGAASKFLYASIRGHYTNVNILHALKEINNSISIIAGEELEHVDTIIEDYTMLNPAIEVNKISNSKYLPQLEKPEEFISLCNIYLY